MFWYSSWVLESSVFFPVVEGYGTYHGMMVVPYSSLRVLTCPYLEVGSSSGGMIRKSSESLLSFSLQVGAIVLDTSFGRFDRERDVVDIYKCKSLYLYFVGDPEFNITFVPSVYPRFICLHSYFLLSGCDMD